MNSSTRDYQRSRVYRWEQSEWWWADHYRTPGKAPELSLDDMRRLAVEIVGRSVRVKDGRGRGRAAGCSRSRTIWMPKWTRTVPVLCHELAHVESHDKHGPWFVAK